MSKLQYSLDYFKKLPLIKEKVRKAGAKATGEEFKTLLKLYNSISAEQEELQKLNLKGEIQIIQKKYIKYKL